MTAPFPIGFEILEVMPRILVARRDPARDPKRLR
jgi:hypothetical protein